MIIKIKLCFCLKFLTNFDSVSDFFYNFFFCLIFLQILLLFEHFYTFCFCSSISTATNWSFNLIVAMTFLFLTQWLTRCENSHPRFHLNLDFPSGQNRDFLILGQVWCLLSLRRPGAPWLGHFSTSPARNPGEVSAKHHLSS